MERPPPRSHWQAMSSVVSKVNLECQAASVQCPNPKSCSCVFSEDGNRVFFRGSQRASQASTLLYADLGPSSTQAEDMPDELHAERKCYGDVQAGSSRQPEFGECTPGEIVKELEALPHAYRHEVFRGSLPRTPLTREEQLLHERQRTALSNFSAFHYNAESKSFLFSLSGSVYLASTETSSAAAPKTCADGLQRAGHDSDGGGNASAAALCTLSRPVLPLRPSARLHLQWCPGATDVFAFVLDGDVWVASVRTSTETRLTYSGNGESLLEHKFVSAGSPPYVIQEQFERFSGFWFQKLDATDDVVGSPARYRILYEQVDEHLVEIVTISGDAGPERLRYPRPGGHNALSTLRYVEFSMAANGVACDIQHYGLSRELHQLMPEMEYLVHAGWIPGQDAVWVYMMSRLQRHCKLIYIPLVSSHPVSFQPLPNDFDFKLQADACQRRHSAPCVPIGLLKEEKSCSWINAHDCIHFLAAHCSRSDVHFIWAEESATGFRGLQYISCPIACQQRGDLAAAATAAPAPAATTTTADATACPPATVFQCVRCTEAGGGAAVTAHVFSNGSTAMPSRQPPHRHPHVLVAGQQQPPPQSPSPLQARSHLQARSRTLSSTSGLRAPGLAALSDLRRCKSDTPGTCYSQSGGGGGFFGGGSASGGGGGGGGGSASGGGGFRGSSASGGGGFGGSAWAAGQSLLGCGGGSAAAGCAGGTPRDADSTAATASFFPDDDGGGVRTSRSGDDITPRRSSSIDRRTWQSAHALPTGEAQFSSPKRRFYSPDTSQHGSPTTAALRGGDVAMASGGGMAAAAPVAGAMTSASSAATAAATAARLAALSTGVVRLDAAVHAITQPVVAWQVDPVLCHVDEQHECVYFTGTKDSPVECHLYVMCYADRLDGRYTMLRLTPPGFYHNVAVSPCGRFFVSEFSSLSQRPWSVVYDITFAAPGPCLPRCVARCVLGRSTVQLAKRVLSDGTPVHAQMFSFLSESGYTLYGTVHPPNAFDPTSKYPTVLYVYGGPLFQEVVNQFPTCSVIQMLNSTGFTVVEVDGRGSSRRGDDFEKALDGRLGDVECVDQVEGLKQAAARFPCVDVERCGVFGWSYGGYMALLLLAKYPELIQTAVAVAPVTDWSLYDTAFTERYLSLPSLNEHGYRESSALSLASQFPNIEDRVLIVHGLADENVHYTHTEQLAKALTSRYKPHRLLPFAGQRHGIRKPDCNTMLYISMLTLFKKTLQ